MEITLDKKLQGFRQIAQEKLQSILCSIPDSQKDLVIETCLIKPLEHVCGASWLRLVNIVSPVFCDFFGDFSHVDTYFPEIPYIFLNPLVLLFNFVMKLHFCHEWQYAQNAGIIR